MNPSSPSPSSWRLDVRGLALRVWELSPPGQSGPPVICLHGWLDHGLAFQPMASGRPGRWLALDQRGFGGSDPISAGAYPHFPDYLGDLDALVRIVGGPVDLVGHAMGGTVAAMYAGARPEQVRRLVVLDGLGALHDSERSQLQRVRMFLDGVRRPPHPQRLASVADAARRLQQRHPGIGAEHARLLAEHGTIPVEGGVRWSFDPLHLTRAPYPFREDAFLEFLAAIRAPTLVVWAARSVYLPEEQRTRAGAIAGARVVTVDGGHMLPYEAPEVVGDLVADHLS